MLSSTLSDAAGAYLTIEWIESDIAGLEDEFSSELSIQHLDQRQEYIHQEYIGSGEKTTLIHNLLSYKQYRIS